MPSWLPSSRSFSSESSCCNGWQRSVRVSSRLHRSSGRSRSRGSGTTFTWLPEACSCSSRLPLRRTLRHREGSSRRTSSMPRSSTRSWMLSARGPPTLKRSPRHSFGSVTRTDLDLGSGPRTRTLAMSSKKRWQAKLRGCCAPTYFYLLCHTKATKTTPNSLPINFNYSKLTF